MVRRKRDARCREPGREKESGRLPQEAALSVSSILFPVDKTAGAVIILDPIGLAELVDHDAPSAGGSVDEFPISEIDAHMTDVPPAGAGEEHQIPGLQILFVDADALAVLTGGGAVHAVPVLGEAGNRE